MQKHPANKSASGFTLIELVIAVAVIGILTSVAVLGYIKSTLCALKKRCGIADHEDDYGNSQIFPFE